MKTYYLGQISKAIFLTLIFSVSVAAYASQPTAVVKHKTTFSAKDPFRTAVFIKNNNLIENETGEKILYHVGHGNINAFFTPQGIIYQLSTVDKQEMQLREAINKGNDENIAEEKDKGIVLASGEVEMRWIGANPNPEVEEGEQSEGYYTYLEKSTSGYTTLKAYGYKTITYKNMYPGIDIVYSIPETGLPEGWNSGMKYNIIVHPGADVNKIKINYRGEIIKGIKKDKDGNVIISTICGDIMEHAPASFSEAHNAVASQFDISENYIHFSFPESYNSAQTLIIDPWVNVITSLPSTNMGFDVDYDLQSNTFIYGAGPSSVTDVNSYFSAAKYSTTGSLLWQFNGSVPAISWSSESVETSSSTSYSGGTTTTSVNVNIPSNIIIEKSTGNMYVGKGYDGAGNGTSTIRINGATGAYDNFITVADPHWLETWCFAYNCNNGDLLALGGGVPSDINMGVINTNTGAVAQSNITGITTGYNNGSGTFFCQDILCGTDDNSGNLYVIMNSSAFNGGEIPYNNTIYRVDSTYNGHTWAANSNFTSFTEVQNDVFWDAGDAVVYGDGNAYNALAANGSYLFYYDGYNVAAYNLANGSMLGTITLAAKNHTALYQGGIAVDNCNNVYVGGIGEINTFTFNDSTFTARAPISLGSHFLGDNIHDVKYNSSNNLLYVTGDDIVGTYTATLSASCTNGQLFTTATTHTCSSGTVTVTPGAGLSPVAFTYVWTNSSDSIVSQTTGSSSTTNTIDNLAPGAYIVQVQWNDNCSGATQSDTIVFNGIDLSTNSTNADCGNGGSASASVPDSTGPYNYAWSNGDSSAAISNLEAGAYTVTVSNTTCSVTASVNVDSSGAIQLSTSAENANCGISNGSANASVVNGTGFYTYAWSNGDSSAAISNLAMGTYIVTVSNTTCSATASVNVDSSAAIQLSTGAENTNCGISNGSASTSVVNGTGFYTYAWSNGDSSAVISNLAMGTYTVTVSNTFCSTTALVNVDSSAAIQLSTSAESASCGGSNGSVSVSVINGTGFYTYAWSNGDSGASISNISAGIYSVTVTGNNGCINTANDTVLCITGIEYVSADDGINIYPNPTTGSWQLAVGNGLIGSMVEIYDADGRLVYQSEIRSPLTNIAPEVARGVYILKLTSGSVNYNLKLLKME